MEAAVQTWPDWLTIGFARFEDVCAARQRMETATAAGDGAGETASLSDELQGSLQVISAAVFALDAFYGVIRDMVVVPQKERQARERKRAGRAVWVADTIRRASRMPNDVSKTMTKNLHLAYQLRDRAVHPPHIVEPYAVHPGLNLAVPQFYSYYTLEASRSTISWAAEAIMWVVDRPQLRNQAILKFAQGASEILHSVIDDHVTVDPNAPIGGGPVGVGDAND
jgi:hypothetical protein